MKKLAPLFADSKTAAMLLCMTRKEFLNLVENGALPPAGHLNRWDVQELTSIMRGDKARSEGEYTW